MTAKLGFQVVPGRNLGGVANRYIRMADGSYLELLDITRPEPDMAPGMLADHASLHGQAGSRTFGLRSTTLDAPRAAPGRTLRPHAAPARVAATTCPKVEGNG
jgi:hypothetical protein